MQSSLARHLVSMIACDDFGWPGMPCPGVDRRSKCYARNRIVPACNDGRATKRIGEVMKRLGMAALLLLVTAGASFAQTYPSRIIRLISPNPPGGANDTI